MNERNQVITIIGCGYVGLTTAAVLANCGFRVYALEIDAKRLGKIQAGQAFFYEPGIDNLLATALRQRSLIVTNSYEEAIPQSSIVFSCVGTPDNPDGSSNLSYVFESAKQASALMQPGAIFVQKSTVPVGTGQKVENIFENAHKSIPYASNPEFLREGSAISDTLWFDRAVAGSSDKAAANTVLDIYKAIEAQREGIAKLADISKPAAAIPAQYFATGLSSAELIKVTANAFLALKISFANSIAKLADQSGADVVEVMDAVGADKRIGKAFLNAGRGYGGGCFPKDVSGLIRSSEDYGVGLEIMQTAAEVNESMPHYIINKARPLLGEYKGQHIAVLGLAFKSGTSDTRRSPAIAMANSLAREGAHVCAYDPKAMEEAQAKLDGNVELADSVEDALKEASCVFITTDWPEFKTLRAFGLHAKIIVDCVNCLNRSLLPPHIRYVGVGIN